MEWVNAKERQPTNMVSVPIWVVDSSIHFGEDYLDVGAYSEKQRQWLTEVGGESEAVQVSYWIDGVGSPARTTIPRPSGTEPSQPYRCNICGGMVRYDGTAPKAGMWP